MIINKLSTTRAIMTRLLLATLLFFASDVKSHGIQVRHCTTNSGVIRIFVEHWHSSFPYNDDYYDISKQVIEFDNNGTIAPVILTGYLNGTVFAEDIHGPGDCVSNSTTLDSVCASNSPEGHWSYFDFPIPSNSLADITLLQSNAFVFSEACNELYPVQIRGGPNVPAPLPSAPQAPYTTKAPAPYATTAPYTTKAPYATKAPSSVPSTTITPSSGTSGTGAIIGDPHYVMWGGSHYFDYQGACDQIVFTNDLLQMQMRSTNKGGWSAPTQIVLFWVPTGEVIFRFDVSAPGHNFGLSENNVVGNFTDMISYELTNEYFDDGSLRVYPIHSFYFDGPDGDGSYIRVVYNPRWSGGILSMDVKGNSPLFRRSKGVMGSFDTPGEMIFPNGTIYEGDNIHGEQKGWYNDIELYVIQAWQVPLDESKLNNPSSFCGLRGYSAKARRNRERVLQDEQEANCPYTCDDILHPLRKQFCETDVLLSGSNDWACEQSYLDPIVDANDPYVDSCPGGDCTVTSSPTTAPSATPSAAPTSKKSKKKKTKISKKKKTKIPKKQKSKMPKKKKSKIPKEQTKAPVATNEKTKSKATKKPKK